MLRSRKQHSNDRSYGGRLPVFKCENSQSLDGSQPDPTFLWNVNDGEEWRA
jgi:hypothetical protein